MDFVNVTAVDIPEGGVKEIRDTDMTLLWSKVKIVEYVFVVQAQNSIESTSKEFVLEVEE
ncbi:MAG: hypothetical protein IJ667_09195 [Synergistaceae bacterium]|nr:hypothetical protein [Synergistaceae bacterium]